MGRGGKVGRPEQGRREREGEKKRKCKEAKVK